MTQYERIQQMGLEELATLLFALDDNAQQLCCESFSKRYGIAVNRITVHPAIGALPWIQFLKSEVPEGDKNV